MQSEVLTEAEVTAMKMPVDRIRIRNEGVVAEFRCCIAIEQVYVK